MLYKYVIMAAHHPWAGQYERTERCNNFIRALIIICKLKRKGFEIVDLQFRAGR